MKYLLLICLLVGCNFFSNAQDFFKGYYVKQEGDTIRGLIEDRSDLGNFIFCNFKSSPDARPLAISKDDIIAYGFDEGVAYQKFVYKEKDNTELAGFFRILVRGKLTLIKYNTRYFAVTNRAGIYEVSQTTAEEKGKIRETNQGLGHLKLLMSDCPVTNEDWLLRSYSDDNLKKIFITYNECVNSPVSTYDQPASAKGIFNVGVQILPSMVNMKSRYPMENMDSNITVAGGFVVSLRKPRQWLNTTALLEVNYYQYNSYKYLRNLDNQTHNDVFVKYNAIQLPVYLRLGRKYFADLGIQNTFLLKQDMKWRVESVSDVVHTSDGVLRKTRMYSVGLMVGAGARFDIGSHPLTVFARYSQTGRANTTKHTVGSIGVAFQLTKN